MNRELSKSLRSLILSLPLLLESVTYALNGFSAPLGGFARSITTVSIVWPGDLKSG